MQGWKSLCQPLVKDFIPIVIATQPISTATMEEAKDATVPTEELDRYFLSPLADQTSPIPSHLEVVHEHFCSMFPIDPTVSAILQKSLLKVARSADPSLASEFKEKIYSFLLLQGSATKITMAHSRLQVSRILPQGDVNAHD